jgi:D-sedoheptulose 7-phosphate isomerase
MTATFQIFSQDRKALATEGDMIGTSTSGNSQNVIKALDVAKKKKLRTVLLTGLKV